MNSKLRQVLAQKHIYFPLTWNYLFCNVCEKWYECIRSYLKTRSKDPLLRDGIAFSEGLWTLYLRQFKSYCIFVTSFNNSMSKKAFNLIFFSFVVPIKDTIFEFLSQLKFHCYSSVQFLIFFIINGPGNFEHRWS